MRLPVRARDIPARIATGGYILHSGLEKWNGDETRAKAVHGVASKPTFSSGGAGGCCGGSCGCGH